MSLVNSYIEADLDFLSAMVNDPAKDQQYTSAEKGARNMLNAQWTLHENDYFQYNSGLMTEDLWQAKLGATKRDLLKCEHLASLNKLMMLTFLQSEIYYHFFQIIP